MNPVTDPAILEQLNGSALIPVTDPNLLAQLNGNQQDSSDQLPLSSSDTTEQRVGEVTGAMSFGLDKDIAAGIYALSQAKEKGHLGDFSNDYRQGRDLLINQDKAYSEAHPVKSAILNIAGSLPSLGLGSVEKLAPRLATFAGFGAANSLGNTPGDITQRAKNTGIGAIEGATGGELLNQALRGAGKLYDVGKSLLTPKDATVAASQKIAEAIQKDKVTTDTLSKALGYYGEKMPEKQQIIADIGGENTQRLAEAAYQIPTAGAEKAKNVLDFRGSEASTRITEDISKLVSPEANFLETSQNITKEGQKEASPIYDAAFKQPIKITNDLQNILSRPALVEAQKRAIKIAQNDGIDLGQNLWQSPDARMQIFDYMKKGLDDIIETYRDKTTGKLVLDSEGRSIIGLKKQFVSLIDKQNPLYAKARSISQGYLSDANAMQDGRSFMQTDAEQLAQDWKEYSKSEKSMFKVGVAKQLRDIISKKGDSHDLVKSIFGNPDIRGKLQTILPSKDFNKLKRSLEVEQNQFRLNRKITGGSNTIEKNQAIADLNSDPAEFMASLAKSPKATAWKSLTQYISNKYQTGNKETAKEIANIIFETNPKKQQAAIKKIADLINKGNIVAKKKYSIIIPLLAARNLTPTTP